MKTRGRPPPGSRRNHGLPLVIDEVQYAPELFRQIKLLVDGSDNRGQLYPVEIKKASQAVLGMAKNFPCIRQLDFMQTGTILCQCDKKLLLAENVQSLPLEYV